MNFQNNKKKIFCKTLILSKSKLNYFYRKKIFFFQSWLFLKIHEYFILLFKPRIIKTKFHEILKKFFQESKNSWNFADIQTTQSRTPFVLKRFFKNLEKTKNSWNFVDIQTTQSRTPFVLTRFFQELKGKQKIREPLLTFKLHNTKQNSFRFDEKKWRGVDEGVAANFPLFKTV